MLQIKGLYYNIGERELFKGVDCAVNPGKRLALIGPNGTGKTTLFRIITGEIRSYQGEIVKPKGFVIGYLPQEEIVFAGTTALKTVLEGCRDILELETQIAELHEELEKCPDNQNRLLKRLGDLEHGFQAKGGYEIEAKAKTILSGLGFLDREFSAPLTEFSGGWRMRIYLARLLIQDPDVLLLDEPTNHLDLPSLEWLEKYLMEFAGSIVFISHDRTFIDRLSDEIYELEEGKLYKYPGKYSLYEERKEQRIRLLRKKREEWEAEKARQERFIEKYRTYKTRAAQVQSRIRYLEKLKEIELPEPPQKLEFRLSVETPSFKDVLDIENAGFRYNGDWVLKGVNLHLSRGDRIALVGKNGAGKTTLSRLAAGELKPQEGKARIGKNVTVGYYAQHQIDMLDLEATVYDEVSSSISYKAAPYVRNVLGTFQFSGDDVFKKIKVLSGGEKARVSLAKILLSPVNFLIMDEPTTHLDLSSIEALEYALMQYDGTLLLISHDRRFLDKLIKKVVEMDEGQAAEYWGNYSDYMEKREKAEKSMQPEEPVVFQKRTDADTQKEKKRREAEARQAVSRDRARLNQEIERLESCIDEKEKRLKEIESEMAEPATYSKSERVVELQKQHASIKRELPSLYEEWEQKRLQLETLLKSIAEKMKTN